MIKNENRESILLEAVRGCKVMHVAKGSTIVEFDNEKDALRNIKESHMLIKRNEKGIRIESDKDSDEAEELFLPEIKKEPDLIIDD